MSIAVAVIKNNNIVLATDSQITFGSDQVPEDNLTDTKIRKIGNVYLASTGWSLYDNILDDLLDDKKPPPLNNNRVIFSFFNELWKHLHKRYSFVNDQSGDKDTPFGDIDSSFLIAAPSGIFYVSSDLAVSRLHKFFAIGSGSDYSFGALHALYDQNLNAKQLAAKAVDAAIHYNVYCGGKTNIVSIKTKKQT